MEDLHIHMVLDGVDWKAAIAAHAARPDDGLIRARLEDYRARGVTFLRDGGDRWGVCALAARLAPEYGIRYRMPTFPIYKSGHYGSFIGRGYETLDEFRALVREVKERGGRLSQGQKQLLAFARTIISAPKILILDEATSAIDTKTEQYVQEGIAHLLKGRTSFIIAHRLSTIRDCDRIMYVSNQTVTEYGTHDELMAKKGDYYKLYTAQLAESD